MKILAFLLLAVSFFANAQTPQLSENAQVSVITCGPGEELFTSYGHSALRVYDPDWGIDRIYNYGTFDFNAPNFYMKFTLGKLNYFLSAYAYERFLYEYQREGRWVKEQVLNIPQDKKQAIFEFVEWNYLPENKYYLYDFFFDNCATRIRDLIEKVLGDGLSYDSTAMEDQSFRDLIRRYQADFPWSNFGIDIALGGVIDRKANYRDFMFLPDYIHSSYESASYNGSPLVLDSRIVSQETAQFDRSVFPKPGHVIGVLFLISLLLTVFDFKRNKASRWFDFTMLSLAGLLGILIVFLWFFTDHTATAKNFSLLWAIPIHLPVALALLFTTNVKSWIKSYFLAATLLTSMILVAGLFIKQSFHPLFYPLMMVLIMRCWINYFLMNKALLAANK